MAKKNTRWNEFFIFYLSLRASLVGGALHLFWGTMRPQDSAANILIS